MDKNSADWRIGNLLDGRYEITEILGIGGMAIVYKAFDHKTNRYTAIKVLREDVSTDDEYRKRFRTEYQAVAMLSHPHIRTVYDVVVSGDTEYIVMEYLEGINLKEYIRDNAAFSWKDALQISIQISRALEHAHSKGIVHMDIKPQNIMVLPDNTIKITDFGIARLDGTEEEPDEEAVGSIHYVSPEQIQGKTTDRRTDIFSLGVVMYEMLTGRLPFNGKTPAAVAKQHREAPVPIGTLADGVPSAFEECVEKAMNPDVNKRYSSAGALAEDLEKIAAANKIPVSHTDGKAADRLRTIRKDVPRISRSGELSREAYVRRRMKAKKVSLLLGIGISLLFILVLIVFVWQYWLHDIFREAERISVDSFEGQYLSDVVNNPDYAELYDFSCVYRADASSPNGMILDQNPAAGESRMITDEGIKVSLSISSGIELVDIPDVSGCLSTEAQQLLQEAGLNVLVVMQVSQEVAKNYVISVSPDIGSSVSGGSFVTLTVSAGPEVNYVPVPNLIGADYTQAMAQLNSLGLICAASDVTFVSSADSEKDLVIWQSVSGGTEVVENTKIYLTVGTGSGE